MEMRREPVTLAILSGLAVLLFLVVAVLSRIYHSQQQSLAEDWSSRGTADLAAQQYASAVTDFRTSLLYDRDNNSYQLSLAEALLGENRTDEARTYLMNLWERQPENGTVNLELARIAASKGQTESALRYYHNAIYATWPADEDQARKNVRLELINLLLQINYTAQAQSELIALAANLGDDPSAQANVAGLFLRTHDYEQALSEYRLSLKANRRNAVALAGAGKAAFELSQYISAERYLREAVDIRPGDKDSAARLQLTELVLQMDPFRRQMRSAERNRIVVNDFAAAGDRLKTCQVPAANAATVTQKQSLAQQWAKLKPQVTERGLRRNPDMVNTAMELVFNVERSSKGMCGAGTEIDQALLLIAKMHEGL